MVIFMGQSKQAIWLYKDCQCTLKSSNSLSSSHDDFQNMFFFMLFLSAGVSTVSKLMKDLSSVLCRMPFLVQPGTKIIASALEDHPLTTKLLQPSGLSV